MVGINEGGCTGFENYNRLNSQTLNLNTLLYALGMGGVLDGVAIAFDVIFAFIDAIRLIAPIIGLIG